MALLLTSAPALEPITLAEAKNHLKVDETDDDTLISSLITSARMHVETELNRALITQGWSVFRDRWPQSGQLSLPLAPVQGVSAITLYSADGTSSAYALGNVEIDTISDPARLTLTTTASPPEPGRRTNGIEIAITAGYGPAAANVPEPIRQAILMLTAHWYENREPVALGAQAADIPGTVTSILHPYRRLYL